MEKTYQLSTEAVRAGSKRSEFGEHSEALFLTSSFVFENAAQAAARFKGEEPGMVYSRFTNPSVQMFEERLAALEGAEKCVATASGMAAILSMVMGLLKSGDHIVASKGVFGSTINLFNTVLNRFGIETSYAHPARLEEWEQAITPKTRLLFAETPSNPLTEICDIAALSAIARANSAWLAIDNCFCTPALQRPFDLGADIIIHSATKYLDGQGRVLGGAVLGSNVLMEGVFNFIRSAGPSISPFNAWVIFKGMETLQLRMEAQSKNARGLAQWLEQQPKVQHVFYPGLPSHPQYELAKRQQKTGGAIVSFEMKGGREAAWKLIDSTDLISITGNLGDTRSTITHPATTTHGRISQEARDAAGITEGLVRIAVGLEALEDLQGDLAVGLS